MSNKKTKYAFIMIYIFLISGFTSAFISIQQNFTENANNKTILLNNMSNKITKYDQTPNYAYIHSLNIINVIGGEQSTFTQGETVIYSCIIRGGTLTSTYVVTTQTNDPLLIGYLEYKENVVVPAGEDIELSFSFDIPSSAESGNYSVQTLLWTEWPWDGGICIDFITDTFEVVILNLNILWDGTPIYTESVNFYARLTTESRKPLPDELIYFFLSSDSLDPEYIGKARTDQNGEAYLEWSCNKPIGNYMISAELQYKGLTHEYFYDFENYDEFQNSNFFFYRGTESENGNGIIGHREVTPEEAWDGQALKTWDEVPEGWEQSAEAAHYFVMDEEKWCYDRFEVSAYVRLDPSILPPKNYMLDNGIFLNLAQSLGAKMDEGDYSIYAGALGMCVDRPTGDHIWVYGTGEGKGVIIPGLNWEDEQWYHLKLEGDVKTKKYGFSIWDADLDEEIYKKDDIDFFWDDMYEGGTAQYIRIFGFCTSGRDRNTGYFDDIKIKGIVSALRMETTSTFTIVEDHKLVPSLELSGSAILDVMTGRWHYELQATLTTLTENNTLSGNEVVFFLSGKDPFFPNIINQLGASNTNQQGIADFSTELFDGPPNLWFYAEFRGDDLNSPTNTQEMQVVWEGTVAEMLTWTPNLDLHAYDIHGRHVGINYETNQVEVEIPGAYYSGDTYVGVEWIYLPPTITDYYLMVNAHDAESPIEEYNLTIATMPPQQVLTQVSFTATISNGDTEVWVPQISPETNELEVLSLNAYTIHELEQLIITINELDSTAFDKNPLQRKATFSNKLQDIIELMETNTYQEAYEKLLREIKPKLTSLKTDANEIPWGNGVFKKPWVIDLNTQEEFRLGCNLILAHITILRG
ncbi:MAG: hypothetical protein EU536_04085 [Promethearchaeota archaeon]|nr:MAG: hypothetical protein EU536_04085 [Candidatus Lokiarchaeota archaeon]